MLEILAYGFLIVVGIGLGVLAEQKDWGGAAGFCVGLLWGSFIAVVIFFNY